MKTCPLCETAYANHQTNCARDGALLIESHELEPGTLIRGKYRIERFLGRGGMGTVYLAEHILLGRQRALKFISSELSQDPRFLKRFRHEAKAASELRHPNVVEVLDLDQAEDGSPYIAMEYVEGEDLRQAMQRGPLSVERALAIARGVTQGLHAAHAKGIVHRDVKPENILLAAADGDRGSGQETPKLLDFGIAAIKESATAVSRTHGLMLTPEYAAPEQWRGIPADELDCRTDLYALGGVLYEMLTGTTSFQAQTTEGWMYQHLHEQPQAPSLLRPELLNWPRLDDLILRLLAKDRAQRFPTAAALLEALSMQQGKSRPATLVEETFVSEPKGRRGARRSRAWKWAIAAAAMVAAGMGIWYGVRFPQAVPATTAPVFAPAGGSYTQAQPVAITDTTPNAVIHYTVDGSAPSEASPVYTHPVSPLPSGSVVRAMAKAKGHAASLEVKAEYQWTGAAPVPAPKQEDMAYDEGKSAYGLKDYVRARKLFEMACNGGEVKGCNYLGYLDAQGLGGARDTVKAREVYAKACDAGNLSSCASLGSLEQDGGKSGEARKYFEKACNGGLSEGCELLRGLQ